MATMSAREFTQVVSAAKREAAHESVEIGLKVPEL